LQKPAQRPLAICDLTQFYSPVSGGIRRYIEQKSAYLRSQRPDCRHIIIVPGEKTEAFEDGPVRFHTIASQLVSRTSRYRLLTKLHIVEEILEAERPDIIESGDPYQVAWKAVASGRGLDIPVVGFYHSHFPEAVLRTVDKFAGPLAVAIVTEICKKYVTTLYNHFEATFVPSPVLARLLTGWGVENTHTVDLGVDDTVFRPDIDDRAATRTKFGIPAGAPLLLYVGRLAPEKNVQTLFDAFTLLKKNSPLDWQLLCLGDGTRRSALLELKGEASGVHWMPFCSNPAELAAIYRSADLFVHPSVQETFGLVTLESQASGTPVVGIRGSYMDRIIFTDQTHWATENTPAALAEAIRAKFQTDLRAAGLQASAEARSRYSWNTVFSRLLDVYTRVVANYAP
jgi:alpha-1,6-mannosyltransferase